VVETGQGYVTFISQNLDVLRNKINDEIFVTDVFEIWYTEQMNLICTWLSERLEISLHQYQLGSLSLISKVTYLLLKLLNEARIDNLFNYSKRKYETTSSCKAFPKRSWS
jgi:calcium-dependent secretion activator